MLGLLGLLAGCKRAANVPPVGSGQKEWIHQDFDDLQRWSGGEYTASLTQERAHSGQFSLKAGPGVDYSLTFSAPFDQLSLTKPRKLRVQAWVWVPEETNNTTLVITAVNSKGVVSWEGIQLANTVKGYKSWQHLDQKVMMSPQLTSDDVLKLYLWQRNGNDNSLYLDDLIISEEE
ncbi:hypothetical protein F1C16_17825 [Hymenobacter sp. NBH84]|nr:hypothetical protein F1C16_17825 [Hymenobacter sp. NBH84]